MKPEFQAKFLQHLNKKKQDGGFTLIELLVVIIIIGILAAIALPSLLAQSNKARQSEARNNVGTLNRAQQAYFLEKSGFVTGADAFVALGVGIASQTTNYKYEISSSDTAKLVGNFGLPLNANILKAYAGVVYITAVGNQNATQALACESKGTGVTTAPTIAVGTCPTDFIDLGK